jgi:hypothetical protein
MMSCRGGLCGIGIISGRPFVKCYNYFHEKSNLNQAV